MPSRLSVEELRSANVGIVSLIDDDLNAFWGALDLSKPEASRDLLVEFIPTLTTKYGDIAATVAADWYDQERAAAEAAGVYRASLSPVVSVDAVAAEVRYGAGHLFTDSPVATLGLLLNQVSKYALQPGRNTITQNANREHVRWARVPTGAHTCAFCLMLASRGFAYGTGAKAGDSHKYHGRCDCVAVPSWSDHPALDGYHPEALRADYQSARQEAGNGSTTDILSALRQQQGIS